MSIAIIGTVAAVTAVGATAYSIAASSGAASDAANAQNNATATNQQTQLTAQQQQQKNFDLVQSQNAGYRQTGEQANSSLQQMLSGGYNMQASPSAQYALGQGTKAINSNLQARGLEGNAVQQLGQLSSSTAATDYQNRFNQLLSATGIGQNAVAMTGSGANSLNSNLQSGANNSGSLGQSGAQNLGNISTNNANTQAGLIGGAAGNLGGYINQLGSGGGGSSWNGSNGSVSNYSPNTTYAGNSPGPWAGGTV